MLILLTYQQQGGQLMLSQIAFRVAAALAATVVAVGSGAAVAKPPPGKGGGGSTNTAPKFDVWVVKQASDSPTLWHPSDFSSAENPTGYCTGETPDAKTSDIVTVVFFHHQTCATLTTTTGATLTDDLTIRTNTNSGGQIVSIRIEGQDRIGRDGVVHQSAAIVPTNAPVTPVNGTFTIEARGANVPMYRCNTHTIKSNTVCDQPVGTFDIDDIRYVARTSATSIESTIRHAPGNEPQ